MARESGGVTIGTSARSAFIGSAEGVVSKDGETFVMLREPAGRQRRRIVLSLNWLTGLKAKVPTR